MPLRLARKLRPFSRPDPALTLLITGSVVLEMFYTGLEPQEIRVGVSADRPVTKNVDLSPPGGATINLDAFMVESAIPTDRGPNARSYRPARTHVDFAVSVNLRRNLDL